MPLQPIAPGASLGITATPIPAGLPTSIANMAWAASSSDGVTDIQIVPNASDATGLTATLNIPDDIIVGAVITIQVTYTNPDQVVGVGVQHWTVVAAGFGDLGWDDGVWD